MSSLGVHSDVGLLRVNYQRHIIPERRVPKLSGVLRDGLIGEEVIRLEIQKEVNEPSQILGLEEIEAGLIAEHGEVGKHSPELTGHLGVSPEMNRSRHVDERVHQNDQLRDLCSVGSQPDQIELRAPTVDILLDVVVETRARNHGVLFDVIMLGASDELDDALLFRDDLVVGLDLFLFLLIDLLHGCFEKTLYKSGHVVDWAIDEELLDESLARKCLQ